MLPLSEQEIDNVNERYLNALFTMGDGMSVRELLELCHDIHAVATTYAMTCIAYKEKFGELPKHDN